MTTTAIQYLARLESNTTIRNDNRKFEAIDIILDALLAKSPVTHVFQLIRLYELFYGDELAQLKTMLIDL